MARIDISFEERKKISLEILDEIKRVSELLDLKFYLAYGTLLGAVRHKGFIPWDDDVDIWMMRKDFKLFLKEFNNICSKNFKLLSFYEDSTYPFIATKVVSTKTYTVEKALKPVKDLGIWVDIFPLDYLSHESAAKTEKLIKLEHRRWMSLYRFSTLGAKIKLFFYNLIQKDTSWADTRQDPGNITLEINSICENIIESDYFRSPTSERSMVLFYNPEDFKECIELPFEDRTYPVPSGYKNLLENIYGDYMKLPSSRQRRIDKHLKTAKWV